MVRTGPATPEGSRRGLLYEWYEALLAAHGRRGWWPGKSRTEIILGAILTQNTAWTNAEATLAVLRAAGLFDLVKLHGLTEAELVSYLRSSGAFRQKARKVMAFLRTLDETAGGSLARMARIPTPELRAALLGTWGIGPETADCILLYAFGRPVFVVDAYTRRVLARHNLQREDAPYAEVQALFHDALPTDPDLWNDYHAQFVRLGQEHCRREAPRCCGCPLEPFRHRKAGPKPRTGLRGMDACAARPGRRVVYAGGG
jgi:endonuclease-3 related protein